MEVRGGPAGTRAPCTMLKHPTPSPAPSPSQHRPLLAAGPHAGVGAAPAGRAGWAGRAKRVWRRVLAAEGAFEDAAMEAAFAQQWREEGAGRARQTALACLPVPPPATALVPSVATPSWPGLPQSILDGAGVPAGS